MTRVNLEKATEPAVRETCRLCGAPKRPMKAFTESTERITMALSAVRHALDSQEKMIEVLIDQSESEHPTGSELPRLDANSTYRKSLSLLTPRECEVLVLVSRGKSNRQVATSLGIAEKTVKNHLSAVFSKIGACDRTQAVVFGIRGGIVAVGDARESVLPWVAPEKRVGPLREA